MTKKALILGAVVAALASGCRSDAEKVCDKLEDLAEKAGDEDQLVKRAAARFKDSDKCLTEVEKLQKDDAEVFDQAKDCILDADKIDDAIGCMFKAALDKKKKS